MIGRTTKRSAAALCAAALGLALAGVGCAPHEARPAFQRSLIIDGRGISVPLPPPSLYDAPKQSVDLVVNLVGEGDLADGIDLRILDNEGAIDETIALERGTDAQTIEGLTLDLTMNCLELWLVDAGIDGEHVLYRAAIADGGQAIQTVSGCE